MRNLAKVLVASLMIVMVVPLSVQADSIEAILTTQKHYTASERKSFASLRQYLKEADEKPILRTRSMRLVVRQAEVSFREGKYVEARAYLISTVTSVNDLATKKLVKQEYAAGYASAVQTFLKSWPAQPQPNGGYPAMWHNAPIDSVIDSWGMYNRESVSYAAFRVSDSGRHMPYWGGRGNANQWDDNARASGIPVDSNPKVGDVAVSNPGMYGHAMYVEVVAADGSIYVSDYNQQNDGLHKEYWISAAAVSARNLVFIHFP